jgi:hypothetical protein
MFPLREGFAMNPPCSGSDMLRSTGNVVIFPGIRRREPGFNVSQQFVTYEAVSSSQRSWSGKTVEA